MKKIIKVIGWVIMLTIVSLGMAVNSYAAKPSDYGLKEGDLISAVFSDDPDVYIVNGSGYKRLFLNPTIFNFYGHLGGFFNIKLVSTEVRDSFITSGLFRDCEINDPKVYGVDIDGEDTGKLHWINVSADKASSEDLEFFKKVFCINSKELNWYSKGGEFKSAKDVPVYERVHEKEIVTTQEKITENAKIKDIGQSIICHYPPGNAAAYQTITVDASALRAHLDHGDVVGVCPVTVPAPTSTSIPTPTPVSTATPTPTPTVTSTPAVTPTPTPTSNNGGATPTPTPNPTVPDVVTIYGRLIDYFTRNPVVSVSNSQAPTNSNGEFAYNLTTATVTVASPKSFGSVFTCYQPQMFSLTRASDSGLTVYTQAHWLTGGAYQTILITTPEVHFTDIPLWPAVDVQVNTDVPAKFSIWTSPRTSGGNSSFKNIHMSTNAFMLEADPYVTLTDAAGNVYISPTHREPLSYGCKPQVLSYYGGVFKWEEYPLDFDPVGFSSYNSGDSNLHVGIAYNYPTIGISGGVAPYAWSVVTGTLPPGITFSQSGAFTGTPTATGTYAAMLKAVDANGVSNAVIWTLTVNP